MLVGPEILIFMPIFLIISSGGFLAAYFSLKFSIKLNAFKPLVKVGLKNCVYGLFFIFLSQVELLLIPLVVLFSQSYPPPNLYIAIILLISNLIPSIFFVAGVIFMALEISNISRRLQSLVATNSLNDKDVNLLSEVLGIG